MVTAWEDRLKGVVFPALMRGLHIYTGFGELIPGHGVPQGDPSIPGTREAIARKPLGLPAWQVYLGVKDTQPAIRFMQFIHRVRNPRGPGALVYPTRLQRDGDRGVALILPLGEGLDTPSHELNLAQELQASILYRPVRVIALGRVRPFTTKSPWSLSEHILMEVYSEAGDLIWTNPILGLPLEETLEILGANEQFHRKNSLIPIQSAVPPTEAPSAEACAKIVLDKAMEAELDGDSSLGLTLRTLALRMTSPDGPSRR
jgi:hypothetical protein